MQSADDCLNPVSPKPRSELIGIFDGSGQCRDGDQIRLVGKNALDGLFRNL